MSTKGSLAVGIPSDCHMSSSRMMDPKVRETEGDGEDSSGKKKSKFKNFKKFFVKKKRKETSSGISSLKFFQSTSNVAASHNMHVNDDSEDELKTHKGIMGSRALSHDSIFIPETTQEPARPVRVFSQENVSDRIRALQLKLQPTMKLGPPPPFVHAKRTEDAGTSSEDDGLPRSPPETSLLYESLNSGTTTRFSDSHKHLSSLSLAGTGSEEEEQKGRWEAVDSASTKINGSFPLAIEESVPGPHYTTEYLLPAVPLDHSSRSHSTDSQLFPRHRSTRIGAPQMPDSTILPAANFDTPPELSSCLDNSAAKHKLLIKPRNQRSSKIRRFSQRTQSESLTDLSFTLEEEDDKKEMQADFPDAVFKLSNQDLPCSTAAAQDVASWPKPRMPEDLLPALRPVMIQPTSESAVVQEALLPENKPEGCQPALEKTHVKSESSSLLEGKDCPSSSYFSPDKEVQKQEESSETPVLLSEDVSNVSSNILNQENEGLPTVFSANKTPSKEDISISMNSICSEGSEENVQKDYQIPVEMPCNEEAKKEFALLSESSKQFSIGSSQPMDPFHVSHPASSTWIGSSASCSLEKTKTAQETDASDKENRWSLVHREELLGKKAEKASNELNALRKFSVSSARERPRTRSLHFPERSELEDPLNSEFFLSKAKVSRNERWKEDMQKGSDLEEEKSSNKKQALLPGSDSENPGQPTGILAGSVSPAVNAVPVPSDSSVVSQNQQSCEDKSPFLVKLRSTSLSLKYKDNSSPESKGIKRYSAEFHLENEGLTSFLKSDKTQIKKPSDMNGSDSLNEKIKPKAKSSEQLSSKPPLPKKPTLQSIALPNTSASKEKQDKTIHSPESRNEDKDLEKKSNFGKVPAERSLPPPMAAGDSRRDPNSPTEPAWISIARQKQRGMQQEKELDREKPVAPDIKSDAEKQNKEKEQAEGSGKQQWNKPSHLAPKIPSEEHRKETKSDVKEPLLRTNSLSHYAPVAPPAAQVDKEEISHFKKASTAALDQPSWMELAKKKSQAWSDMPQIIK
ncbi:CRACD-like protein isoform X3 [Heliangelus exortis]|uniref:CRACD-like protein isoform X3 n=1 Tax=Heliangelus exortis TaxID=472823 RepID=UPI003A9130A2